MFFGKIKKIYCVLDAVGVVFKVCVFIALEASPKISEKLKKNGIFFTLTSPLGLYLVTPR